MKANDTQADFYACSSENNFSYKMMKIQGNE